MLNESKYYKTGIIPSSPATSSSSSSNSNSLNTNSLKPTSNNMHETSKSHHHHPNNNNHHNSNNSHHHFNLHTFNQYNQPNKSIANINSKNFNDYNNNNSSINKEILNSNNFESSPKMINMMQSSNNHLKNGYSSICSSTSSSTSSTGSVNVKFTGFFKDKVDEREKYLTAKYPNHQMALIKKRLKVEFWIDEQLKSLFDISVSENSQAINKNRSM